MATEFWQSRWCEGRIGFHKSEVNPLLTQYFTALELPVGSRVLVPLSGKSIDMAWLAAQGYEVVGIELIESAVQDFFTERGIVPGVTEYPELEHAGHLEHIGHDPTIKRYQGQLKDQTAGQPVTIWAADIFSLTPDNIGPIDAVYDRAALIALPANARPHYTEHLMRLARDADGHLAPQLVVTLDYDQSQKEGPPFAVTAEEVKQYYGHYQQITELANEPTTIGSAPNIQVTEHVWLLR